MNIDLKARPFYLNDTQIQWVEDTLSSMSEEDKLRQLFCLVAYDDDDEQCRHLARDIRPGGFLCRAMKSEQAISTVRKMQEQSDIPLLVAANLESGGSGVARDGTSFARPMQIAATGDVEHARRLGEVCGAEGAAVGVNWSFAPLVDIDNNWRNPAANTRTFGSNPETVERMSVAYVEELQRHGVAACIKHFPGDGCDERDQHVAISVNSCSCEEWDATYGRVYRAGIEAGVKSVMIGHILLPSYTKRLRPSLSDSELLPASLNEALVTELLRERLGFNGLIVTDSTAMAGLAVFLPREQIVPMTIAAGCDMFLFTKNLDEDIEFMRRGYQNGVFGTERLNEAVTRILAMKAALGLPERKKAGELVPRVESAREVLRQPRFLEWSRACADEGITLVKCEDGLFPITPQRFPRILFCPLDVLGNDGSALEKPNGPHAVFAEQLRRRGFAVTQFCARKVTEGAQMSVNEIKENYDLIIYTAAGRPGYQPTVRVRWENPQGANIPIHCHTVPTVFISFDYPYYLPDVPHMRTYINCYVGSAQVMEELMKKLMGERQFRGVSPIDPFCGKWETRISFGPSLHLDKIKP